jgi:hypothetical protein
MEQAIMRPEIVLVVDTCDDNVGPLVDKLTFLKETISMSNVFTEGWTKDYAVKMAHGLEAILNDITEMLEWYRGDFLEETLTEWQERKRPRMPARRPKPAKRPGKSAPGCEIGGPVG